MQEQSHDRLQFVTDEPSGWQSITYLPETPLPRPLPDHPLPIAEMANFFGVTHRTLHFYEEKSLLQPDRHGAMRIYPHRQIRMMGLINLCRETGMAIVQIQDLLTDLTYSESMAESEAKLRAALIARRNELVSEESLIRRQMQQITTALAEMDAVRDEADNQNFPSHPPFLSDSEFQCLKLMAEGYNPVRISKSLDVALEQVLTMEAGIVRKFSASNRFQAVAKAVLLGIVGD
jgi:DNA-binding transcriptional MerR regulator